MEKKIINQKIITQLFSEKKGIKLKNASILTADVNHIVAKDIIELYLKLNFCKKISWIDNNGDKIATASLLSNLKNILTNLISLFTLKLKVEKQLNIEIKEGNPNCILFNEVTKILYIRTDHWFNLKSGGSVGHTSGVINSMLKKGVLHGLISSSNLFNVNWEKHFLIQSPNYSKVGNIPNLPELTYNLELINLHFKSTKGISFNAIYQRYSLGNFYGIYLRRKFNIPLIIEFNGSEIWVSKNWNNKTLFFSNLLGKIELLNLKLADKIIVVSQVLKNTLEEKGISGDKILVNPNGVDTTVYKPNCGGEIIRKKYSLTDDNVVGFIGTFGKWHGAIVMANSIKLYFDNYPNTKTKFLLIGEGNDLPEVKEIIKNAGYEDAVIYAGRIDQSEGPKYLDACNILLSPHIPNPDGSDFFGSPTKLFEYMAMEKAIIASNLNQIGEILEHEKTALLIEPNNPMELAKSIYKLILDKEKQKHLGLNARIEVVNNYSWDMHVEKILNFISKR